MEEETKVLENQESEVVEVDWREDYEVHKFYFYSGPNYYLNKKALVFNVYLAEDGQLSEYYKENVISKISSLEENYPIKVTDLFVESLVHILKLDMNLFINRYSIISDGDEYTVAVEYLDKYVAEDAVYFVRDWFRAMNDGKDFDFDGGFKALQDDFIKTLYGGPTLYSLIEAGLKRDIPVNHLFEENQFQWGYGKKQIRGRSTTFSVDGIKDTEFTMYKDMVGDFLELFGFPTPNGKNCFTEDEIAQEALKIGFPVVVKPVAGHKGQGVTTGIRSEEEARKAFRNILKGQKEGSSFDGAIVQKQIFGYDHRLLSIGGKFAAALERVPAYVIGNGENTIDELIELENATENRKNNPRSPLGKIQIDDDMMEYLQLQDLSLEYVPQINEQIFLRRVANISQGGVSINVTDKIHPKNVKLVEDIAKYLNVTALGIDVLAKDISVPWDEGNFGIIEVNAGPGVFMHLVPAIGGSIDVPGKIMRHHFPKDGYDRIPIIAGNNLSLNFSHILYDKLKEIKSGIVFESLTKEGVYLNRQYFFQSNTHDTKVKIILRNPKLDFAMFNHTKDDIFDYGIYHEGADIVILDNPHYGEMILKNHVLPYGFLVEVLENKISVYQNTGMPELAFVGTIEYETEIEKDYKILKAIEPLLPDLVKRYDLNMDEMEINWNYAKF